VGDLQSIPLPMKGMLLVKLVVVKIHVDIVNGSERKDFPIYNLLRFLITTLNIYPMRYPLCYLQKLKA
jgi:hypothetical protein